VDFEQDNAEYEYHVDALSGEVISDDMEWDDYRPARQSGQGVRQQNRLGWDDERDDDLDDRFEDWLEREFGFD